MRKLRLSLDDIAVDSFPTESLRGHQGTVAGHGFSQTTCHQVICDCITGSGHTCDASCNDSCNGTCHTCGNSCDGGCGTGAASCNGTCVSCNYSCQGTCAYDSRCLCTVEPQIIC